MAKDVRKNLERALEIESKIASAVTSRSPKAASSTLSEVMNFIIQQRIIFRNFCLKFLSK